MKANSGFKLRTLGGEYILVPQSGGLVKFNKIISFNATAAYLWEQISTRESFTADTLTDLLVEKYDIDRETASSDARNVAKKWIDAGIVTE